MANPQKNINQYPEECEPCNTTSTYNDPKKEEQQLKQQLKKIKHKIAVISGKGGVGKSTVTANLTMGFAMQGYKVGVLDADIHGPCIPKMLGLKGQILNSTPGGIIVPVTGRLGVKVASIDFLLQSDETPVIWRGPLKMRLIQQFLSYVAWGELDFLFIDLPPGTGDEPLTVMQLIPDMDGVLIVTMPSELSEGVVKKSVSFAKQVGIPIIGIIENMSGFVCPDCGKKTDIFQSGGGKRIAEEQQVPYLGSIPIDPTVCTDSDKGYSVIEAKKDSPTTKALNEIVLKTQQFLEKNVKEANQKLTRIIIPSENQEGINSLVAAHFGQAPYFTIVELNENKEVIKAKTEPNTSEHMGGTGHPHDSIISYEPNYIIACAMGQGALNSFKNACITVLKAEGATVKEVVDNFKMGTLKELTGGCPHAHEHHH